LSDQNHKFILDVISLVEKNPKEEQINLNLNYFLETILVDQNVVAFERLFKTNIPQERIKEYTELSPNEGIRDLFTFILSQLNKQIRDENLGQIEINMDQD